MSDTVLAVDIGGTSTKVALVSREGQVRHWCSFATEPPLQTYVSSLRSHIAQVAGKAPGPIAGTACALAGFVGAEGTLLYNGNLPWLEGHSLAPYLQPDPEMPLLVESDSNAACAGESLFGVGAGVSRLVCLTIGTGVGVGVMVQGELVRTAFGCLGDAGHVVIAPEGPPCTCGGRGCAEAVLSTVSLGQRYGRGGFRQLVADVALGDAGALALAQETGTSLGIAIASMANIFAPECVAIAGGLAHLGDPLLHAADASFRRHAGAFIAGPARLALAHTGAHATLLGAAACFFAQAANAAKHAS